MDQGGPHVVGGRRAGGPVNNQRLHGLWSHGDLSMDRYIDRHD